jgi:hypothetical protein
VPTIKYYYHLDKNSKISGEWLISKKNWDYLRVDDQETPFSIPKNRHDWIEKSLKDEDIKARAEKIVNLLKKEGLSRVVSVGVGCAFLEYNIKRLFPEVYLSCSDFSPNSIERLKQVFIECDSVEYFDLLSNSWHASEDTLYLLHRVDQEFNDKQWEKIFSDMAGSSIKYVLFLPCQMLTMKIFLKEQIKFLIYRILNKKIYFAGYVRTKNTLNGLWEKQYTAIKELDFGKLHGFLLERK